mgnify:CR=1 FL=1
MTTRRSFLKTLAGGAAAAATASGSGTRAASAAKPPLGLQLYSLRAQLAKDVSSALKQVKAWGIDEVESYGPYGVASFSGALENAGLRGTEVPAGYEPAQRPTDRRRNRLGQFLSGRKRH